MNDAAVVQVGDNGGERHAEHERVGDGHSAGPKPLDERAAREVFLDEERRAAPRLDAVDDGEIRVDDDAIACASRRCGPWRASSAARS